MPIPIECAYPFPRPPAPGPHRDALARQLSERLEREFENEGPVSVRTTESGDAQEEVVSVRVERGGGFGLLVKIAAKSTGDGPRTATLTVEPSSRWLRVGSAVLGTAGGVTGLGGGSWLVNRFYADSFTKTKLSIVGVGIVLGILVGVLAAALAVRLLRMRRTDPLDADTTRRRAQEIASAEISALAGRTRSG